VTSWTGSRWRYLHATTHNGDYFQYTFYGTAVDYITEKNVGLGNVDIYIDSVSPPKTVKVPHAPTIATKM